MSRAEAATGLARAPSARRANLAAIAAFWPALLVLALAVARQASDSLVGDVSWLITAAEAILDGKTAYVDFLETNPPAAIFIYVPPVLAARLSGTTPEFMVALFCFLGAGASLALSALILRRFAPEQSSTIFAGALAVLLLLPAHAFAQREHIAVILGLPFFAVLAARAGGAEIETALRVAAGLGAGIMISIKPHFALMIAAIAPYFVWRIGWKGAAASLEIYVAAAVCALHAAATILFFPAYIERIAPLVVATYLPVRYSWLAMASGAAFAAWLVSGAYLIAAAREKLRSPLIATPALASCGAMLAYLVQGKGWSYQFYPAIALMAVAVIMTIAGENALRRFAPGAMALAAILAVLAIAPGARLGLSLIMAPIGVLAIAAQNLRGVERRQKSGSADIATVALGFIAAIVWAWLGEQDPPFSFEAKAAALAPHPKVVAITRDLNVGFPFVRRIGGAWAQRANMLWITAGARWRIRQSGDDPKMVAAMRPYLKLDRDMLVEDIRRNRPDIVLISDRLDNYSDWAFADPLIASALKDYRLYAADGPKGRETFLYARADLLPPGPNLQPSLAPR